MTTCYPTKPLPATPSLVFTAESLRGRRALELCSLDISQGIGLGGVFVTKTMIGMSSMQSQIVEPYMRTIFSKIEDVLRRSHVESNSFLQQPPIRLD